jgi:hypothetical protein
VWPSSPSITILTATASSSRNSTGRRSRKNDKAFLAVDDVAALQAAADRLSPEIIRKRLDYWTRQQPLPPPARWKTSTTQRARSRLPLRRRQGDQSNRRIAGSRLTATLLIGSLNLRAIAAFIVFTTAPSDPGIEFLFR